MNNAIQFLLKHQFKRSKQAKPRGFTLLELLVAIILAALVITPLLGFMINILATDRREQAKATSEQEIQAALDYIAQDLEQAVYIYDQDGLTNTTSGTNDTTPGIQNQLPTSFGCPAGATCTPILVLWKRSFLDDVINGEDDAFVYSLVGYSLVEGGSGPWSDVARIARFEIRDGLTADDGTEILPPDDGFAPFSLAGSGDIKSKMNRWKKESGETYDIGDILVDYIDEPNSNAPDMANCQTGEQRVPPSNTGINSFVACINSSDPATPSARVYIRGNALARIQNDAPYSEESSFFPTASIQVKGNSFLYTE